MTTTKLTRALLVTLLSTASTYAGAGRHDRPEERYLEMGKQFPAVGSVVGMFTGTLIAPEWILTCAHGAELIERLVPDEKLRIVRLAGKDYTIAAVVLHPDRKPSSGPSVDDENSNQHDIALLRLTEPVVNVEPLRLYTGKAEAGAEGMLVGCGSWIPDGRVGMSLAQAMSAKRGDCHAGTNRIDQINESDLLVMTFDAPESGATDLEMGGAGGDSGCPMLIQTDGKWSIVGVSAQGETDMSKGVGRYGDQLMGTRVSKYADWIHATIQRHPTDKRTHQGE